MIVNRIGPRKLRYTDASGNEHGINDATPDFIDRHIEYLRGLCERRHESFTLYDSAQPLVTNNTQQYGSQVPTEVLPLPVMNFGSEDEEQEAEQEREIGTPNTLQPLALPTMTFEPFDTPRFKGSAGGTVQNRSANAQTRRQPLSNGVETLPVPGLMEF